MKEELLKQIKEELEYVNNIKNELTSEIIITKLYDKYLYEIKKEETNKIYIYIGTYSYSKEIDIIHGSNDFIVAYDSSIADYRTYWNIEQRYPENIPISLCNQFEKENIVINPKSSLKERQYYKIQREFFYILGKCLVFWKK